MRPLIITAGPLMPPDESWLNDPSGRGRKLMRTLGRWPAVILSVSPLMTTVTSDPSQRGAAPFSTARLPV
jgi:hypothetical protein